MPKTKPKPLARRSPQRHGSAVDRAIRDIERLEAALKPASALAFIAWHSAMAASEELGNLNGTGAGHACLALMEVAQRAINQGNDAARYSRHAMEYPPNNDSPHLD